MKSLRVTLVAAIALGAVALTLISVRPAIADPPAMKVIGKITPGGEGGWDYLTVDSETRRLFVSRSTHVQVIDIDRDTLIADIPNTNGVHGIALAPELGKGFTSNGRDSSVTIIDLKTLAPITTVKIPARNPDAICYDAVSKRVFTFNGGSDNATALDATTGTVAGNIDLGDKPEFAVADGKGHIYVNLEDSSAVVALDTKAMKVISRWPITPNQNPSGLAMDREHRRLFSVCGGSKTMVVIDPDKGKIVASLPIGEGTDGAGFDAATQCAYSSNGEGTITLVHEDSPDKYTVVGNIETQRGARTMAVDEKTHALYTVAAQFNDPPPATPENPHPRRTMVPGTFVILKVGK